MSHGYKSEELVSAVWKGKGAMVQNDGSRTNEEAFWEYFGAVFGEAEHCLLLNRLFHKLENKE